MDPNPRGSSELLPRDIPRPSSYRSFADQSRIAEYMLPEFKSASHELFLHHSYGWPNSAIEREIEKRRIREEIIMSEIVRRRVLEAEVRRELTREREFSLKIGADSSSSYPPPQSQKLESPTPSNHSQTTFIGLGQNHGKKPQVKVKIPVKGGVKKKPKVKGGDSCFFCHKKGHMKKECPKYFLWLEKKGYPKPSEASGK